VYETFEHSGVEQPLQLIFPFETILRVRTIVLIILAKSKPPSRHSEHKQLTFNTA
jgi:hypothetical protein